MFTLPKLTNEQEKVVNLILEGAFEGLNQVEIAKLVITHLISKDVDAKEFLNVEKVLPLPTEPLFEMFVQYLTQVGASNTDLFAEILYNAHIYAERLMMAKGGDKYVDKFNTLVGIINSNPPQVLSDTSCQNIIDAHWTAKAIKAGMLSTSKEEQLLNSIGEPNGSLEEFLLDNPEHLTEEFLTDLLLVRTIWSYRTFGLPKNRDEELEFVKRIFKDSLI